MNRHQRRQLRAAKRASAAAGIAMVADEPLESDELREIRDLCNGLRLEMDVYSDNRQSRLKPGHPDRRVYVERKSLAFWWEGKAANGKLSKDQVAWKERAESVGDLYGWGGYDEFYIFLEEIGVIVKGAA